MIGYDVAYTVPLGYRAFFYPPATSLEFPNLRPIRYGRRNWAFVSVVLPPPPP